MDYFKIFSVFLCVLCVLCGISPPFLKGGEGGFAFASNCNWIETTGEAAVENITPEEARQLALNRARIKAVEGISNVNVKAITLVQNLSLVADFINTISAGYVLEEKDIEWNSKTYQEKKDSPPVTIYTVKLKSCVTTTLPGDPYFKIKAELNRPFFLKGEEAKIKATCTKDCYLTIVNFTAEGNLKVLLPNDYEPSPFIKAGGVYNFPSEGLALEMHTLTGHKKDTEVFILIATKERFDILLPLLRKEGIEGRSKEDISPKDFYNALLNLPADTRAEELLVYEVKEKEAR